MRHKVKALTNSNKNTAHGLTVSCIFCNTFINSVIRCECKRLKNRLTGNGGKDSWVADAITTGAFSSSSFFFSAITTAVATTAVAATLLQTQEAMTAAVAAAAKA